MGETERGCGWRKMGGVYLVCDGASLPCDALPVEMGSCPCCEFRVNQARSIQPIHAGYLASLLKGHKCHDDFPCPICWYSTGYPKLKAEIAAVKADLAKPYSELSPLEIEGRPEKVDGLRKLEAALPKAFYLMYVSKDFYTPESFVKEATTQGISKRVAPNSLPKGFQVGKDWIFLAHGEVPFYSKATDTTRHATGIFYAFKPERLEVILWKGTDGEVIRDYEDAGYTVVLLEKTKENLERHGDGAYPPLPVGFKRKERSDDRGLSKDGGPWDPKLLKTFEDALANVPHKTQEAFVHSQGGKKTTTKKTSKQTKKKTPKTEELEDGESDDQSPPPPDQWTRGEL